MSKIRIKNFGPIKEGYQENDGWLDIKKVTVFIGNQGSGKSTVAKLISVFTWIEKALVRGDYNEKSFSKDQIKKLFFKYHRIENYFRQYDGLFQFTEIEYEGDAYHIKYYSGKLTIQPIKKNNYSLPQIMYVPAERNFISYVENPKALKQISDSLIEFVTEFEKAKKALKEPMRLPINNVEVEYDEFRNLVLLKGTDYELKLTDASSGFQSLVPLYLVSWFLANSVKKQSEIAKEPMSSEETERFRKGVAEIWANESLTDEQRRVALSVLSLKFNKTTFINIVEEPEQNLFPASQWEMLKSLLEFNNMNASNKLIMTTHSPYIINYLSIAIQSYYLYDKVMNSKHEVGSYLERISKIVPYKSMVSASDVAIYQLDEKNGTISKLPMFEGIPSDKNFLNTSLLEGNELFDALLEIEEDL